MVFLKILLRLLDPKMKALQSFRAPVTIHKSTQLKVCPS